MIDNFLPIGIYLVLQIAAIVEGLPKNSIDTLLARISPQFKVHTQKTTTESRQRVVELAEDNTLFIAEHIFVCTSVVAYFLIILLTWLFWLGSIMDLALFYKLLCGGASVALGLISIWLSNQLSYRVFILLESRKLYREEKIINANIPPEFDETAYLLKSPANVEQLRRGIREYESGQCVSIDLDK